MPARKFIVFPQGGGNPFPPQPPVITSTSPLPQATAAEPYSFTFQATGGAPPYTWSSTPLGVFTLNSSTGTMTGTPGATGTFNFTITVTDSLSLSSSLPFSLTVVRVTVTTSSPLPAATQGVPYSTTLAATNGVPPYTWSATGLGLGLSLTPATGVISGTPSGTGTLNLSVTATDSLGAPSAPTSLSLTVSSSQSFAIYLGPNGDDTLGNGSISNPYSITYLNNFPGAVAGQRVGILPGTYTQGKNNGTVTSLFTLAGSGGGNTSSVITVNGGSAATPTYIATTDQYGNDYPGTADLNFLQPGTGTRTTATNMLVGQGNNQAANKGNVTIRGLIVHGGVQAGIGFFPGAIGTYPYDPSLGGSGGYPGVTIDSCTVYDIQGNSNQNMGAIVLWDGLYNGVVTNCNLFQVVATAGNASDAKGISTFNVRGMTYQNNTIWNVPVGIQDKTQGTGAGQTGGGNVIKNNLIVISAGSGYALGGPGYGNPGEVWTANNNILDVSAINSAAFADSSATQAVNQGSLITGFGVSFYNNTCITNYVGDPGWWQRGWGGATQFYNNIMYDLQSSRNALAAFQSGGASLLGNYNLLADATGNAFMGWVVQGSTFNSGLFPNIYHLGVSSPSWQTVTGADVNSVINTAPQFAGPIGVATQPVAANYQLAGTYGNAGGPSPGVNLGRIGGVSGGGTVNAGAWDGIVSTIGTPLGLSIATKTALPAATVGSAYMAQVVLAGGSGNYSLTATSISPNWLNWLSVAAGPSASLWTLQGTPTQITNGSTAPSVITINLLVTDNVTNLTATGTLTLQVNPA